MASLMLTTLSYKARYLFNGELREIMKIFKSSLAIAITTVLMTAQPIFGATGHPAGGIVTVPETGSTFALLLLAFLALIGATRLASFRQRKVL
jgi:hypothetical protein